MKRIYSKLIVDHFADNRQLEKVMKVLQRTCEGYLALPQNIEEDA